jgi:tetratricopeptide (TPR) repeat protein
MQSLGMTLAQMGLDEEAESRLLAARDGTPRALGERHPDLIYILGSLSRLYQRFGRLDEAEPVAHDALRLSDDVLGGSHPLSLSSKTGLARMLAASGRRDEAETLLLEALVEQREVVGADGEDTVETMQTLIDLYASADDSARARPIAREMLAALRGAAESANATTRARDAYARALLTISPPDLRQPTTALRVATDVDEASGGENPDFLRTLAQAWHATGSPSRAVETLRRALSLLSERDLRRRREVESLLRDYEGEVLAIPGDRR